MPCVAGCAMHLAGRPERTDRVVTVAVSRAEWPGPVNRLVFTVASVRPPARRSLESGAEFAAPSAPLRHPAPRVYLESSREKPLHSARRQRGGRSKQRLSRRYGQWMMARCSYIFGTLGLWPWRAAPAKRVPGGVGCDERSESHQGFARRGKRCVSLRSTAPYGVRAGCWCLDTACFDLLLPYGAPRGGRDGPGEGAGCLSEAQRSEFSAAGPARPERGSRAKSGRPSLGAFLGKQESTSRCARERARGRRPDEGT